MNGIVLNEKELRDARARVAKLSDALSAESGIVQLASNLPPEVVTQVTKMMKAERLRLLSAIEAFEYAREAGDASSLLKQSGTDPGVTLIVARIAKGYSQKDLAWRLGVKEQQIQRYEADRYSSISLKNYARVAALLGVQLSATITENPNFRGLDAVIADVTREDIRKILKHGRSRGWFATDMSEAQLRQYVAENRIEFGSPSLLRTGLNVTDHSEDVLLHAWRARVATRAREELSQQAMTFDPADILWLAGLVRLSAHPDGPRRARETLKEKGILLIAEPQIPGLAIDGAAFLEGNIPVIALTIRKDTIDNFWFTLLHEIGHAVLHYRTGLATGFFDQLETVSTDEQEAEADSFASNILIPEEKWRRSTARIANSPVVVESFAKELGIHPAIVFGRIRKERNNYSIFSNKIGANTVREQLIGPS
ncbi:HTH-type transcriptional regulator/antitoxin HigA [Sinorhizobium kostiense]|uniref:HTH-type transcriptional regulator/antitoxin HigA n=2 Tax=Sinorhizobium kostiense TaxID=76747 RepID=A0ABS4R3A3_9HYPH|nr:MULTISPECIES: XRE family transcriptional regulator [Sinorhizobium]MBP2236342.1 HTH-type transcriptional regulator/antitoxin HigA [Sinorhizobium kostiense]